MRVSIWKNGPFDNVNGVIKIEMTRKALRFYIVVNLKRKFGAETAANNFVLHIGGQYLRSVVAQDITFHFIGTNPLRVWMHRTGTSPRSKHCQHPFFHQRLQNRDRIIGDGQIIPQKGVVQIHCDNFYIFQLCHYSGSPFKNLPIRSSAIRILLMSVA